MESFAVKLLRPVLARVVGAGFSRDSSPVDRFCQVLRAEIEGTVKTIHAKPGDSLAVDAVILEFARSLVSRTRGRCPDVAAYHPGCVFRQMINGAKRWFP